MAVLEIKTDHYHETQNEWDNRPPVNIACAAIVLSDHDNPLVHTNKQPDGQINDHLTKPQTEDFIRHLLHIRDEGYDLVSWNGTSFDLQTIADVTEMHDQCADLAVDHYDVMFQIFCSIGWPVSLNATALGMGIDHEHHEPGGPQRSLERPGTQNRSYPSSDQRRQSHHRNSPESSKYRPAELVLQERQTIPTGD